MANPKIEVLITAQDHASSILKEVGNHFDNLSNTTRGFSNTLKNAGNEFSSFSTGINNIAKFAIPIAGVALGALAWGLMDVTKEAIESEAADVKMANALKGASKATNEQVDELKKYAEALQFMVGISDEEIKNGMSMLATFKLTPAQVKKITPALIDMAIAFKRNTGEMIDLQQVAIMIGKATGGELYKNLQRMGIVFNDQQLAMLENADAGERLRIVVEELGNEFGGAALAQANTFAGKITILGLYFDDFKEKVGMAILNALTPFIDKIMTFVRSTEGQAMIQQWTDKVVAFAETVAIKFGEAMTWVVNHREEIKNAIQSIWDKLQALINFANSDAGKVAMGILFVAYVIGEINRIRLALVGLTANAWLIYIAVALAAWWLVNQQIDNLDKRLKEVTGHKWDVWININTQIAKAIAYPGGPLVYGGKSIWDWIIGKQSGGSVNTGQPYIVGEQGPELFVPQSSGNIVPNNKVGAGGMTNIININGNINNKEGFTVNEISKMIGRQIELAVGGAR